MRNVNKVTLIGNLGREPEVRYLQSGKKLATLSVATTHTFTAPTGEKRQGTEWHRVAVFHQGFIKAIEERLQTGSTLSVEGYLQTRSYEKNGQKVYVTEIVVSDSEERQGDLVILQEKPTPKRNAEGDE